MSTRQARILFFMTLLAMAGIFAGCSGSITQNGSQDNPASIDSLKRSLGTNTVIVAVAAGRLHSLALTDDGKVFATGNNYYGQLGLGDITVCVSWTDIEKEIEDIRAGLSGDTLEQFDDIFPQGGKEI